MATTVRREYWSRRRTVFWAVIVGVAIVATAYCVRQNLSAAEIRTEDLQRATVPATLTGKHPCVFASLSGKSMTTALGECATPTKHTGAVDRFEVDLRFGAFVLRQSDLLLNDSFDVPLTRSYFSLDWAGMTRVHAFGRNTNHPYDVALTGNSNPFTYLTVILEDGDILDYKRISTGSGYRDAVYLHTETSTRFYKSTISWNGNGWTLRLTDGSQMLFPDSSGARNFAQCGPFAISDAAGNKLLLQRDWQRNLQEIKTPHGHWIHLSYDDRARIVRAEDDRAQWTRYRYNNDGMLTDAISSTGQRRHYTYQGNLMLAVADENGSTLVRNWYNKAKLVEGQQFANGDTYSFVNSWDPKKPYLDSVVVTLPDHSTQTIALATFVPGSVRGQQ